MHMKNKEHNTVRTFPKSNRSVFSNLYSVYCVPGVVGVWIVHT